MSCIAEAVTKDIKSGNSFLAKMRVLRIDSRLTNEDRALLQTIAVMEELRINFWTSYEKIKEEYELSTKAIAGTET